MLQIMQAVMLSLTDWSTGIWLMEKATCTVYNNSSCSTCTRSWQSLWAILRSIVVGHCVIPESVLAFGARKKQEGFSFSANCTKFLYTKIRSKVKIDTNSNRPGWLMRKMQNYSPEASVFKNSYAKRQQLLQSCKITQKHKCIKPCGQNGSKYLIFLQ